MFGIGDRRRLSKSLLYPACAIGALAMSEMACRPSAAGEAQPTSAAGTGSALCVIELFTSQGCPKCPPADKLIGEFAKDPRTIALSYAVNYWDYIGWKDTLASPAFTARQHAYAASRGDRQIYTPQVVVDGVQAEPGADKDAILRDAAQPNQKRAMSVPIGLKESEGNLHIEVGGATPGVAADGTAGVYVLRVAKSKNVEIERGDNSGRTVTYTNVVRATHRIGDWMGRPVQFDVTELKGEGEGYVVLLQSGSAAKPGVILAAAKTGDL